MTANTQRTNPDRNVVLYPWFKLFQSLMFSQAIWFLYFQATLSPAEAILLYAISDLTTTILEVPSGYASDRIGRRITLIIAGLCGGVGTILLGFGSSFAIFAMGQALIGAGFAFASGTDSALLYESLSASGRESEVEAQELKAWQFSFFGFAISAAIGGTIALYSLSLTFILTAISLVISVFICFRFYEQPRSTIEISYFSEVARFASLRDLFSKPILIWLLALSLLMYIFSHLPFVFGQPFIQEALNGIGLGKDAPLVSGMVTTTMMVMSVIASLFAIKLRGLLGLTMLLILAFGMQIALTGVIALTNSPIVIGVLLLRMVPDAFSKPFIIARIQPVLNDDARATYLSLQSLCGRLLFAATLYLAASSAGQTGEMTYPEIQHILAGYVVFGIISLMALIFTARRLPI